MSSSRTTAASRVVDFGIARAVGRMHQTSSGVVKGKVAYMSPEQLRGDEIDRRTDIWALGVTLWELLACRRLFRRDTQARTIDAVLEERVRPPSDFAPHVSAELDRILLAALDRDPAGRPATARELGRALRRWAASTGEVIGTAELAEMMEHLFAGHREAKQRMIEEARRGGVVHDVPDTQKFARPADEAIPTSVEEVSDMRPRSADGYVRPNASTLPQGTMQISDPTVVHGSPLSAAREPTSPTVVESDAPERAASPRASALRSAGEAEREPEQVPAPPDEIALRPTFATGSVVLPVRRVRSGIAVLIALALALALAVAIGFALFGGASSPAEDVSGVSARSASSPVVGPSSVPDPGAGATTAMADDVAPVGMRAEASPPDVPRARAARPTGPHHGWRTRVHGTRVEAATSPVEPDREAAPTGTSAPAPAPAPTAAPAPPGTGFVRVGVVGGWGTVEIDGRAAGQAPGRFEVAAGTRRVAVRPFGEGPPITRTVEVARGETRQVIVSAP